MIICAAECRWVPLGAAKDKNTRRSSILAKDLGMNWQKLASQNHKTSPSCAAGCRWVPLAQKTLNFRASQRHYNDTATTVAEMTFFVAANALKTGLRTEPQLAEPYNVILPNNYLNQIKTGLEKNPF